jgi:preprotein translocase subunit SecA
MALFSKVLRVGEGKTLKQFQGISTAVNDVESQFEALSDDQLAAKTAEFKQRFTNGESLSDLQVEAFATVREAAKRVLGQRHYDVQVIGAAALHHGMVAEMKTGEGKTLVSTMPAYLNALSGQGVHMVTVNDYLASRDADWMGQIYKFLGLSVGLIQNGMDPASRKPAYEADLTHGTNNEFGFDYLRDNMAMSAASRVQRGHPYAIVDEVDSILIDEARTPLIISGRMEDSAKWYRDFARIAARLQRDVHYEVDERKRQVLTTEDGVTRVEQILGIENLFDHAAVDFVHHLEAALKAKELYLRDDSYLIDHGEVKIVDEFTGRVLEGRRYSEGLHQAIEAKEGVTIKDENQTLATITLQNYFRLYEKLAGMTGTAETEAAELAAIYSLEVISVPTNKPVARLDQGDMVYKTEAGKFTLSSTTSSRTAQERPADPARDGVHRDVREAVPSARQERDQTRGPQRQTARPGSRHHRPGRPSRSRHRGDEHGRSRRRHHARRQPEGMAKTELKRQGVGPDDPSYEDMEQKLIEEYAEEIRPDKEKVIEAGGLYVVGTERHESRRIDNQLRGRSGRQGDPGVEPLLPVTAR